MDVMVADVNQSCMADVNGTVDYTVRAAASGCMREGEGERRAEGAPKRTRHCASWSYCCNLCQSPCYMQAIYVTYVYI